MKLSVTSASVVALLTTGVLAAPHDQQPLQTGKNFNLIDEYGDSLLFLF